MELNVTTHNLELAKTILDYQLQFCAALRKQIRLTEAQGASTPDGLKTSGKKATAKKAADKPAEKPAKAAPKKDAAEKAAPKKDAAPKKAAPKKAAPKKAAAADDGPKKVSLKTRVLTYVTKTYKSDDIWSPKILLSTEEFEGTSNVHLSQVLRALCGEGEGDDDKKINKVSRGKYQTL